MFHSDEEILPVFGNESPEAYLRSIVAAKDLLICGRVCSYGVVEYSTAYIPIVETIIEPAVITID